MKKRLGTIVAAMLLLAASGAMANISLVFEYHPETNTTTATYSGTFGVGYSVTSNSDSVWELIGPTYFYSQPEGSVSYVSLNTPTGACPWTNANANSRTGDAFRFDDVILLGPTGFAADTEINGSLTFNERNLTDLGFDAQEIASGGTIVVDTAKGNVNVDWSCINPVPEPATIVLLAAGSVALLRRRSRK